MKILVSNDDGIYAPGMQILAKRLAPLGEVYVIAPDRERSAASHSLTLDRPLLVEEIKERMFSVNGTPTDCVSIGVKGILKERPDLVVSGINKGGNLGDDITYSGTVSAAIEGTLLGIPSMAVSLVAWEDFLFQTAAEFAALLAERIGREGLPRDTLLNINVPNLHADDVKGMKVTRQGKRTYTDEAMEMVDPRGKKYYWVGGGEPVWEAGDDTDYAAVSAGYVSVTPLHLDLTNFSALEEIKGWKELQ